MMAPMVVEVLAVSEAVVTGGAALLGVILGAVVGGVVDLRLEKRKEEAQGRAGARLLRVDLSVAVAQVESAIAELTWWPFYELRMDPWDRYRDVLAVALDPEEWGAVSQSAMELQAFGHGMRNAPGADRGRRLGAKAADSLVLMRANAIRAFNALCDLADDDERLEPSDPPEPGSKPASAPTVGPT